MDELDFRVEIGAIQLPCTVKKHSVISATSSISGLVANDKFVKCDSPPHLYDSGQVHQFS